MEHLRMKTQNTFPLPGGTSAIIFSFPTWGSSFIAQLKWTCFPFTNSKVPWTWTWDFRSGKISPRYLPAAGRRAKGRGQPFFPGQSKAAWFCPWKGQKKKPWKARPPWKVGTRIIHLMNGDLGLKRAEQLPQVHSGQEKGGGVCQEPTLSMSILCAFPSATLSATRDLARLPFFICDIGIDIFFVPLLCCCVF